MHDVRIGLKERDERGSELGILLCELECQRGEDELESAAILNISRAEKGGTQTVVCEQPFCDCLCYCRLSSPGKSIEPEDRGFVEILGPTLDPVQGALSGSLETSVPIPVSISCSARAMTVIQNQNLGFEMWKLAS